MNTATQLKALVRNLAKEKNINAQILLRNYMLERLLERISVSEYKHSFILKGGMLIAAMVGIDTRSTMDMDATIKLQPVTMESVRKILLEILSVDINDNVVMLLKNIEEIRDEAEYPGLRATIETSFDGVKNTLKFDLTTGDKVTPREISYKFKLMFEDRYLDVMAYNLETVVAEKLETIISRGTANTRMRDFYDIYIIITMYSSIIDKAVLRKALQITATNRNTIELLSDGNIIITEISASDDVEKLWLGYQKKYIYAQDISWNMVIDSLNTLLGYVN